MKLYMQVTKDEYEFPIHIANSVKELAEITGMKEKSLASMISRGYKGWVKVVVEDE